MFAWTVLALSTAIVLRAAQSYKPVIVVHGLFDSPGDFKLFQGFINETHPGTNVTVIDLFDHTQSLKSLWSQVDGFKAAIYPIMQNAANGVHMICYSQGGLICRGILSTMPDHNVDTLISLSSPQLGQYGDPHHHKLYLNSSNYLAFLNNERENPNATEWKKNFLRIKKLVLIGGPDDGVITPWQSSQFGFYDEHETVIDMRQQLVYIKDTFGLKSLDAQGAIHTFTVNNVHHTKWHSNRTVFDNYIVKWLT
ncbi:lysosomal thioesterase PPT2 isoform X2 [Stegostoma tigrinum]|uniref:lysosomal thioesterase PPT2 isoform X2 n=1 Tax=Stegostoma tigrinum TaxID=3053191 RepID=UPI00202B88F9|nr:lysosomal thioesterase PPT2 isoform X2 [Stegostoma tigrinum]